MKILLSRSEQESFVREVYTNFPEASQGSSLSCYSWDYDKFLFKFRDLETGKKYIVTLDKAMKGLKLLLSAVGEGELPGLGLPLNDIMDTGNWDAIGCDALAQMAVFGEVIYG